MSVNASPKPTTHDGDSRTHGDRLRVTGAGALYVENVSDFLASKRVQKTISSVNRSIETAEKGDDRQSERERKRE